MASRFHSRSDSDLVPCHVTRTEHEHASHQASMRLLLYARYNRYEAASTTESMSMLLITFSKPSVKKLRGMAEFRCAMLMLCSLHPQEPEIWSRRVVKGKGAKIRCLALVSRFLWCGSKGGLRIIDADSRRVLQMEDTKGGSIKCILQIASDGSTMSASVRP